MAVLLMRGKGLVGKGCGSVGCCGIAHDCQHVECSKEVWAVRRALLEKKKEPIVLREMVDSGHCILVETKNPDWNSDVGDWTGSEGTSSLVVDEHNVESLALEVMVR